MSSAAAGLLQLMSTGDLHKRQLLCRYVMERVPWLHRVVIVEGPIDEGNGMALPTLQSSVGAKTWADRFIKPD